MKSKKLIKKQESNNLILKTDDQKLKKELKKLKYRVLEKSKNSKKNNIEMTINTNKNNKKIVFTFSNNLNQAVIELIKKLVTEQFECEFKNNNIDVSKYEIEISEKTSIDILKSVIDIFDMIYDLLKKQTSYSSFSLLECLQEDTKSLLPKNRIDCNYQWMCDNNLSENELVMLYSFDFKKHKECVLKATDNIPYGKFKAHSGNRALLNVTKENSNIWIFKYNELIFDKVYAQDINKIKDGIICISNQKYSKIDKSFKAYKLVHLFSGESIIIPTSKIHPKDIDDNSIKLSYAQRKLLNLSLPKTIEQSQFNNIMNSQTLLLEEKELIKKIYDNEKVYDDGNYQENQKILKILSKVGNEKVVLIPEITSYNINNYFKKNIKNKIYDFFIGKSEINLKSGRPYMMDENKNIVRLSADNMKLLGIDETDQVIIHYKDKSIKAKVLEMGNLEQVKETNIVTKEADIDILVGIPAHLRKELGLDNINIALRIERDTNYLFMKNLHIQFMPLIALLFTLIQTISNLTIVILTFIVFLPFVIYIIFSEQRYKVK